MVHIVSDILSLLQHKQLLQGEPERFRLDICLCCGRSGLWLHGGYPRKAARSDSEDASLNPIIIQRFYCRDCRRTCSVLPECLPPRRWYLWKSQQIALLLCLTGTSKRAAAQAIQSSRHTISRWFQRFAEQFLLHKDVLCNHIADLGRTVGLTDFWEICLKAMCLAKAMRLCHVAGVAIP